jgi:hypothetical protein
VEAVGDGGVGGVAARAVPVVAAVAAVAVDLPADQQADESEGADDGGQNECGGHGSTLVRALARHEWQE